MLKGLQQVDSIARTFNQLYVAVGIAAADQLFKSAAKFLALAMAHAMDAFSNIHVYGVDAISFRELKWSNKYGLPSISSLVQGVS